MKNLPEIVDFYLKSDTNNVLMINGAWGIGKTYYFKNILAPKISETPTFTNARKKYKPIVISLFGLKSIDDIQSEILLSIYPILKKKGVKLGVNIAKSLFKGIMQLKGIEEYSKHLETIKTDKKDWIDFNDLVICFDDFERLSENLKIEELIGFINSLVEDEAVKIIILANEDVIDKENYNSLTEKIIGNRIEFIQDFHSSYDSLINKRFSGFPAYHKFLANHKDYILAIFQKKSTNMRILVFILIYFHTIYSIYCTKVSKVNKLHKFNDQLLKKMLRFSIAIGIEYKEGKLSYKETQGIESILLYDFTFFNNNGIKKKEEEKTYKEKFKEIYYEDNEYNFIKTIYEFITGGTIINENILIKELRTIYNIEDDDKILPQNEIYQKLIYPEVFSHENNKYKKLTRDLLKYSDKGAYQINQYLTIFYFATRFNNPLKLNIEKLEKRIIKGMRKGQYTFYPSLDLYLNVDEKSLHSNHLKNIKSEAIKINSDVENKEKYNQDKKFEDQYPNNIDAFCLELVNKENGNIYNPILRNFNARKFYSFFLKSEGEIQWKIVQFFGVRYPEVAYSELKHELEFLKSLHKLISLKKRTLKSGVKFTIFEKYTEVLERAVKRFSELEK